MTPPSVRPWPDRLANAARRTVYRLAYPLVRLWWWLRAPRHEGALVAVHVGPSLLLVRMSYRRAWSLPGGGLEPGETAEVAARRELAEEIGLRTDAPLRLAGQMQGLVEGRRDRVHVFTLRLDTLPTLDLDRREIIGARLVPLAEAARLRLTPPVRAYVEGRLETR